MLSHVVHRLTSDMQFTNTTCKALFADTYESQELKVTIYDPYKDMDASQSYIFALEYPLQHTEVEIYEGSSPPKILFQILSCRNCIVYKLFAEETRTELNKLNRFEFRKTEPELNYTSRTEFKTSLTQRNRNWGNTIEVDDVPIFVRLINQPS